MCLPAFGAGLFSFNKKSLKKVYKNFLKNFRKLFRRLYKGEDFSLGYGI